MVQTVIETGAYLSAANDAGMSQDERDGVVSLVAANPSHGDRPSGWGGAQKFRFARAGKGKSGGYRIVTAWCGSDTPVFLIAVFGKGEKANLTRAEANAVAALVKQLCSSYGR